MKNKKVLVVFYILLLCFATGCVADSSEEGTVYLVVRAADFSAEGEQYAAALHEAVSRYLASKLSGKGQEEIKEVLQKEEKLLQNTLEDVYIREIEDTETEKTVFIKIGKGEGRDSTSVLYPLEENEYRSVFYEFFKSREKGNEEKKD